MKPATELQTVEDFKSYIETVGKLLETARIAEWEMELPSGKVTFNRVKTDILGYEYEDFENFADFTSLLHPEDYESAMQAMRDHLKGKADLYETTYRIRKSDGTYLWFKDVGKIVKKFHNGSILLQGVAIDVTDSIESEYRLAFVLSSSGGALAEFDFEKQNIHLTNFAPNDKGSKFQSEKSLLSFSRFLDLVHPEDKIAISSNLTKMSNSEKDSCNFTFRLLKSGGNTLWIKSQGSPLPIEGTAGKKVICNFSDITKEREAELAFQIENERFKYIAETTSDGVMIFENGKTTYTSPGYKKILGYSESENLQRSMDDIFESIHPDDRERIKGIINDALSNGSKSLRYIYRAKRKDGKYIWKEDVSTLEYDSEGNFRRAYIIGRDVTDRKEKESRYKALYTQLNSVINNMKFGMLLENYERKVVTVNQEFCDHFSIKECPDNVVNMNSRELFYLVSNSFDESSEFNAMIEDIVWENKPLFNKILHCNKGRIVKLDFIPINDKDFKGYLWFFRDVTEKETIQKGLVEQKDRIKAILETLPDMMFLISRDGVIVDFSSSDQSKLYASPEYFLGKNVIEIFPTNLGTLTLDKIEQVVKSGKMQTYEYMLPVNGENRFFESRLAMSGEQNFLSIVRDITDKKNAEFELRKLSHAVEESPASIVITDVEGTIEYVNPKFTEVTGYSFGEVLNKNASILKSGYMSDDNYKDLWTTIKAGKEWRGEFLNKRKDDTFFWERALISSIKNDQGEIERYIAVKEDITRQKEMEAELQASLQRAKESDKLKSILLSNMSHELRTPMNGIMGYASLLNNLSADEKFKKYTDGIYTSSKRLMNTLDLVLEYANLKANYVAHQSQPINLLETVYETLNSYKGIAEQKGLNFEYSISNLLPMVRMNPKYLSIIFSQILDNAIKFTSKGYISITSEVIVDQIPSVNVFFADSGVGVSEEKREVIFEEFRQASEGLSRAYEGLGLGLPLVKYLLEYHGGKIELLQSSAEGSIFKVSLPVKGSSPSEKREKYFEEADEKIERTTDNLPKILYVEDNDINRDVVRLFLASDYELDEACNGETAIKVVSEKFYDIILMDINLGVGIDGVKTLQKIRNIDGYENVPIIAVTGYSTLIDRNKLLERGFTHFLAKPFERGEITGLIESILSN